MLVAPGMLAPSFCHWNVGAGLPLAAAVNVTELPAVTVLLAGWVVIAGAVGAAFTVSVAAVDVALPAALVATTV